MTPDLLREVGEALYGERWQSDLARDLNVADRTVRRWAAGDFDMPEALGKELRDLCQKRATALDAVRRKLPR